MAFDLVDRLWRTDGSRYLAGYFGDTARQIRVSTFYIKDDSEE